MCQYASVRYDTEARRSDADLAGYLRYQAHLQCIQGTCGPWRATFLAAF